MQTIVTTGFKLPQAVISNGQTTGNGWSNPNNILLTDALYAESNIGVSTASDFIFGNYNFNLPTDAVIVGIEMQVIGFRGGQTSPVVTLTPYAVDNTSGVDIFYPYVTPFTGLTTSPASYILGGSSYLFATSWTPDQINNLKLQMIANGDISLDSVLVNIHYYVTSSPTPPPPTPGTCITCNSPIQAQPFRLSLPVNPQDSFIVVDSFNYPDGTPIQISDLGACGGYIDIVMDEGKAKGNGENFEENAQVIDIIRNQTNGTVRLDFGSITNRALMFREPYTHDPTLLSKHDAGTKVIISNNAPFESRMVRTCQADFIFSVPIVIQHESIVVTPHVHQINIRGGGAQVIVPNPLFPDNIDIIIVGNTTPPPGPDSTSSATSGPVQVPTLTWLHTTNGINRGFLVQISTEAAATVTGVTYNGIPLTQVVSTTNGTLREEQWFLIAPPIGTYSVVVSLSPSAYISAGAESWVGVDQTGGIGATQTATGNTNHPTLVLTTTRDNSLVISGLSTGQTPILYTPGAGQTTNWVHSANTDTRQGGSALEPAGTSPDAVTMDYSITQTTPWAFTAVELLGIPPAVVVTPQAGIQFEDEGTPLGTPGTVDEFDVVGSGASLTRVGNKVTLTVPGGSSGAVNVQIFSASGTWTMPGGTTVVEVICVGAGGGGGSGETRPSNNSKNGGYGGGGGAVSRTVIQAANLTATVAVTVGTGGAGGAAVSAPTTVGNNGGGGNGSSFGTYAGAAGGSGGHRGQAGGFSSSGGSLVGNAADGVGAIAGQGGFHNSSTTIQGTNAEWGGASAGMSAGGVIPGDGGSSVYGGAGGGAGGRDTGSSVVDGGTGGKNNSYSIGGGGTPGLSGNSPTAGGNGTLQIGYCGSAGGGGGSSRTTDAAAGGNGGLGCGGGGGGSAVNTHTSGAGGNGGDGYVIVISYS